MKHVSTALAATLAAGVIAGCGGDDPKPLSKAEYLKRGNAICAKGQKAVRAEAEKLGDSPSNAEIKKFGTDVFVPRTEDQIEELRDLEPPKGDKETVEKIYDTAQDALDKVKDDPGVLTRTDDPFSEANELARNYGLTTCAG